MQKRKGLLRGFAPVRAGIAGGLLFLTAVFPAGANAQVRDKAGFDGKSLIVPGAFAASGLAIRFLAHDSWDRSFRDEVQERIGNRRMVPFDDYIEHLPVLMDAGLGLAGVQAQHGFRDRCIGAGLAYFFCSCISWPSKRLFHTLRPDGENFRSFPSGHVGLSVTGAELVRLEYGPGWGAGAYTIAGAVGAMRIVRGKHWMSDVLCGIGIGILSARAAVWLLEPVERLFGLRPSSAPSPIVFLPAADPFSGRYSAVFALTF